jgi:hypothetical protein
MVSHKNIMQGLLGGVIKHYVAPDNIISHVFGNVFVVGNVFVCCGLAENTMF